MQKVQLYIEGQRIDFFDDQKISLTQSIQDIKDPANIFTDFSKTFNIPASKTNNKIFKHFYNYDILNGFDARQKVAAEIKINFVSYKKGFIKLDSVKLKDNSPNSYNITFFGETVLLKDIIGEDNLTALSWLDNFLLDYSSSEVQARLQNGKDYTVGGVTYTDAVLAPLITHTGRLFYDSSSGHAHDSELINNLYYESGTGHYHGVLWSDLKYSIRLHLIILAIQEKYPEIVFSDDFFNTSNSTYHNLYLWMHRKKGDVQSSLTGTEIFSKLVGGFNSYTANGYVFASGSYVNVVGDATNFTGTVTLTPSNSTPYNVKISLNGTIIHTELARTGTYAFNFSMIGKGSYSIIVESTQAITFTSITWELNALEFFTTLSTSNQTIPIVFSFYPTQQMPEIKVLDFLKGLFKMFNLTAYVEEGVIKIDTLDNFYSVSNDYDITPYIEVDNSQVDNALPYKQIDFTYADYKTYLASIFNQINGQQFGELKYNGEGDNQGNWLGDIYKINLPFQKMLYERLSNIEDGSPTTIQYGWMVDDNQSPYLGKPLLHYVNQQTGGTGLSFRQNDQVHINLGTYYIPLNSDGITGSGQSLNFKPQYDEYTLVENANTLFENYYKNYISDVFQKNRRIKKITAYLPLKILLNYSLKDRFIINGNSYKINSVKSDVTTGKSDIELVNEV